MLSRASSRWFLVVVAVTLAVLGAAAWLFTSGSAVTGASAAIAQGQDPSDGTAAEGKGSSALGSEQEPEEQPEDSEDDAARVRDGLATKWPVGQPLALFGNLRVRRAAGVPSRIYRPPWLRPA